MKPSEAIGIRKKAPRVTFTYFVQTEAVPAAIKIGSSKSPFDERRRLQEGSPSRLKIVGAVRGYDVLTDVLRDAFMGRRIRADWFLPHPDLLTFIREIRPRKVGALLLAHEFESLCANLPEQTSVDVAEYRRAERYFRQSRLKPACASEKSLVKDAQT